MITIDFNVPIYDIDGAETKKNMKAHVVETLGLQTKNFTMKSFDMYNSVKNDGKLILDATDFKFLRDLLEKDPATYLFATGQVLIHMDAAEKKSK